MPGPSDGPGEPSSAFPQLFHKDSLTDLFKELLRTVNLYYLNPRV